METLFISAAFSSSPPSETTLLFFPSSHALPNTFVENVNFGQFRKALFSPPPLFLCAAKAMSSAAEAEGGAPKKEAKLWGGRFEESLTDIVERFTESVSFDKALYKHDIMGSRAHASMLAHQGLISDSDRDSILRGLDEIERQIKAGEFVWRSDREDVHMNIEAALTDLIGEPAKKLHTARSRNDQVSTDFRLWCRDAVDTIVGCLKHLQVPSFEL